MTDARLRGEWLTAAAHDGLSDPAYRILHNALMHCAEQGTDGAIATRELRFLYPGPILQAHLDELEQAGFWEPTDEGFQLVGWSTSLGQSTASEVEGYRQKGRERQQRWRDRKAAERAAEAPTSVPEHVDGNGDPETTPESVSEERAMGDVTRYVSSDVGQARRGSARPSPRLSEKTRARSPDCARRGHLLDPQGITCLRSGCEYRDADRQEALALEELALTGGVIP